MFQIYFYPYLNEENDIDGFQAQLINDSDRDFLYDITYSSNRQTPKRFTSQVLSLPYGKSRLKGQDQLRHLLSKSKPSPFLNISM